MKRVASCSEVTEVVEGMKRAIFVRRQTTTRIASKLLEAGSWSMKSIEMDDHERSKEAVGAMTKYFRPLALRASFDVVDNVLMNAGPVEVVSK